MSVKLVVAVDDSWGIGRDGGIPWHSKRDMRWFRLLTSMKDDKGVKSALIMGKKTWESIGSKPLPGRTNIVLSSNLTNNFPGAIHAQDMFEALLFARQHTSSTFIIGGASVYDQALKDGLVDEVFLTRVRGEYQCDTFFPQERLLKDFSDKILFYKGPAGSLDEIWLKVYRKESGIATPQVILSSLFNTL
jgi:dihydrofolate reductase